MRAIIGIFLLLVIVESAFGASEDEIYVRAAEASIRDVLQHSPKSATSDNSPVVPSAEVAIAIHDAIASAAYGKDLIQKEHPFHAVRVGDFWFVTGTGRKDEVGGLAFSVIRASNGEVLRLSHPE